MSILFSKELPESERQYINVHVFEGMHHKLSESKFGFDKK